uniref:Transmembrane protein n=1 Tax=Panagrolaimus superbus TaxID=310955 RepID=A0A914YSM1_9BILA
MIGAMSSEKRASIQLKNSNQDGKKASLAGRLSEQMTPPKESRALSTCGQLFLCIIGTLMSSVICIWESIFGNDATWRRILVSSFAAFCAVCFTLLAIAIIKRQQKIPHWEPIPIHRHSVSTRRATNAGRHSGDAEACSHDHTVHVEKKMSTVVKE